MSPLIRDLIEALNPDSATITPAEADRVPRGGEGAWLTRNLDARPGRRMLVTRDRDGLLKVQEDVHNARQVRLLANIPPATASPVGSR